MILDFSRQSIKRFLLIIICITALFWQKIIDAGNFADADSIISVDNFLHTVANISIYLSAAIKLLLLLVCSYCFIFMLSANEILPKQQYLAVVLFWAIASIFIDIQNFTGVLCALLFQIFAFYNVFCLYHRNSTKSLLYVAAFLIGISSMFSFPFIISGLSIFTGLWIFYEAKWRDTVLIFAGLLTPYLFLLYYFLLVLHDVNLMWQATGNCVITSFSISFYNFDLHTAIFAGLVFFTAFISMFGVITLKHTKSIYRMADYWFCISFFISAVIFVLFHNMQSYSATMFGISSACLIVRFSQTAKRAWIVKLLIFVILFAAVAYCNYSLWL